MSRPRKTPAIAPLANHLKETKRHATAMKKALASLGGSHPYLKEGVSKFGNLVAGFVTTAAKDTVVKNAIADFATEHFEIACYNFLIATATALGETKIAATCKDILKDEQAMAKTIEGQIAAINKAYLNGLDDEEKPEPTLKAARGRSPNRKKTIKAGRK